MAACSLGLFNGEVQPLNDIKISPFDRAYLFGDAIYEVVPFFYGRLFHLEKHMQRLSSSLDAIRIDKPNFVQQVQSQLVTLFNANAIDEEHGSIYLQVSRGQSKPRIHDFSNDDGEISYFAYINTFTPPPYAAIQKGGRAILMDDIRWRRCDIKSTNLLANCLAKEEARQQDSVEAILYRDDMVTEACTSTVFAVINGSLTTTPLNPDILPGITRSVVIELAKEQGLSVCERHFSIQELLSANEVFITNSTKDLYPITHIDQQTINKGTAGPIWTQLHASFQQLKKKGL